MRTVYMNYLDYYRINELTLQTNSSSSQQNMPSPHQDKGGKSDFAELLKSELSVLSTS